MFETQLIVLLIMMQLLIYNKGYSSLNYVENLTIYHSRQLTK